MATAYTDIEQSRKLAEILPIESADVGIPLNEENIIYGLQIAKDIINTLAVKEVDLEKHLKENIEDVFFDLNGVAVKGATHYLTVEDVKELIRKFCDDMLHTHTDWTGTYVETTYKCDSVDSFVNELLNYIEEHE